MPDKGSDIFSEEYQLNSSVTGTTQSNPKPPGEFEHELEIEAERYGTGKPKRVTIRAKITKDNNDQG